MSTLPNYDELPLGPGGAPSGWGVFGESDSLGLVNLLTPQRIADAAALIRKGTLFPLDAPLGSFDPPLSAHRGTPRHSLIYRAKTAYFDDLIDNFYPQASSQWDSLSHLGVAPNAFYNGATADEIRSGRRNTIDYWAARGIAGRAVVFDMVTTFERAGRNYDPGTSTAFEVADLEAAERLSGTKLREGDILLLYTGVFEWYLRQTEEVRNELPARLTVAGVSHSEEVARFLWDRHVSAVCSDNFAVEVWPPERSPEQPFGFLHRVLIGSFGMALGELWWLKDLVDDCRSDGRYEAFLVSAPLNLPGGISSTANATAIK